MITFSFQFIEFIFWVFSTNVSLPIIILLGVASMEFSLGPGESGLSWSSALNRQVLKYCVSGGTVNNPCLLPCNLG